jgi:hypothetical protein
MSRIVGVVSLAFVLLFVFCGVGLAASVGGDIPEKGEWSVGFETNIVTERKMTNKDKDKNKVDESTQYLAKASYSVLDWLCFDFKLGSADIDYYTTRNWGFDHGLAWGVGSRAKYELGSGYNIVVGAQYFSATDMKSNTLGDADWKEWQVSLAGTKQIGRSVPYVGVKYSDAKLTSGEPKEVADENVGVFVGTDVKITGQWSVNVEGRFVDETAVSFGVSYRF